MIRDFHVQAKDSAQPSANWTGRSGWRTYLAACRTTIESGGTVVAHGEGAECVNISGLFLVLGVCLPESLVRDAFSGGVQLETRFDLEKVNGEEGVWVARHARLQDGESVLELTDSIAHLCNLAMQAVRVREDEPVHDASIGLAATRDAEKERERDGPRALASGETAVGTYGGTSSSFAG